MVFKPSDQFREKAASYIGSENFLGVASQNGTPVGVFELFRMGNKGEVDRFKFSRTEDEMRTGLANATSDKPWSQHNTQQIRWGLGDLNAALDQHIPLQEIGSPGQYDPLGGLLKPATAVPSFKI